MPSLKVVDDKDEGPYLANMCTKVIRNDDPMSPDVLVQKMLHIYECFNKILLVL